MHHMKTATVRDLRYSFPRVSRWIQEGESVEITLRGKLFATLAPAAKPGKTPTQWPDLQTRLRQRFPHGTVGKPASEIISESRGSR